MMTYNEVLRDYDHYGLGRKFIPDHRDANFHMSTVIPAKSIKDYKYWYGYKHYLDQGNKPWCVDYGWHHFILDSPITHKSLLWEPGRVYHAAQEIDDWPGTDYDGTSGRAGAKVLQSMGLIGNYYWGWDTETITTAILEWGPVGVGTVWYDKMFRPDADNVLHAEGKVVGGHWYMLNGVSRRKNKYRIKNTWGKPWGDNGHAEIDIDEWDEKCLQQRGEAIVATEIKVPA